MRQSGLRPHQKALVVAGLVSLIVWALPLAHLFLLPLLYLNTHLHELSHALVAQATGGTAEQIDVFANGSGVTPVEGGTLWLVASAGYVGSALIGAAMIYFSRTPKGAALTLRVVAVALVFSLLMWVRGDLVGVVSGIFWAVTLWLLGTYAKGSWALFFGQFFGLQQCLNAAQAIYVLLRISSYEGAKSDAWIMQQTTGIPSMFWALGWCGFSLLMVALTLRKAWAAPVRAE